MRAFYRGLPAKRIGAGVLFVDDDGRVLLVRPTYKPSWEIPGGMVEEGESPHEAATPEVTEEIGLNRTAGRLLCVNWVELIARRLVAGLAARDQGTTRYLVDGRDTGSP